MMAGRVVVIDDDSSVRRALARLIRAAGYEVETLEHAQAYLDHSAIAPPACLVLDIRMPGMSGLELQSAIEGTARSLPIVFITGHGEDETRASALSAGAVDVLQKPLDEKGLFDAIERALARSDRVA
jgi:FixJ family two-component response regulator